MILTSLAAAILFALIHLLIDRMAFLRGIPRSRWLSFAGGVAVAYVFLHILPELAGHQAAWAGEAESAAAAAWTEREIWLMALAGLAVFCGLERAVRRSRARQRRGGGEERAELHVVRSRAVSLALRNMLTG